VRLHEAGRFGDVIDIGVTVQKVGRKSITYAHEFSVDGVVRARGSISAVCCRMIGEHQFESIEIPASFREKLAVFAE